MPDFPFHFRVSDFLTEQGQLVRAKRGFLLIEFQALQLVAEAFVDTAAPFSVIPHTFSRRLQWQRLAKTLSQRSAPAPSALLWQGIPCELSIITFRCIHFASGLRSGWLQSLAKFPTHAAARQLERHPVLGLSLLDDNDVRLEIERQAGMLSGLLSIP